MTATVSVSNAFQSLSGSLTQLESLYRALTEILAQEKFCLIQAEISALQVCLKEKENILSQISEADQKRELAARQFAMVIGNKESRLISFAELLESGLVSAMSEPQPAGAAVVLVREMAAQLREHHRALTQLVTHIANANKENSTYASSALRMVGGAFAQIKGTLQGRTGYSKQGRVQSGPDKSGNFVSREV